jgi:hypothetical protein
MQQNERTMVSLVLLLTSLWLAGTGFVWVPVARAAACAVPPSASARGLASTTTSPVADATVIQIQGEASQIPATPASLPAASPVADTTDAAEALTAELTAVSEALAACLSEGDAKSVAELAGERYLGQLFGSSVPLSKESYIAVATGLTPVPTRIVAVEEVTPVSPERATAVVTQVVGNQYLKGEWTYVQLSRDERPAGRSLWQVASERPLPSAPPPLAVPVTVGVEIRDRAFKLDQAKVKGPDVVLRGHNVSNEDHEMLVLRLATGFTTTDLLRGSGPDLPHQATYIGEQPVRAGATSDLVLVDLAPGTYTIVCLFPDSEGTPHLAQGMEATFRVE